MNESLPSTSAAYYNQPSSVDDSNEDDIDNDGSALLNKNDDNREFRAKFREFRNIENNENHTPILMLKEKYKLKRKDRDSETNIPAKRIMTDNGRHAWHPYGGPRTRR